MTDPCDVMFENGERCAKPAGHCPPGSNDLHMPAETLRRHERWARWQAAARKAGLPVDRAAIRAHMAVADEEQRKLREELERARTVAAAGTAAADELFQGWQSLAEGYGWTVSRVRGLLAGIRSGETIDPAELRAILGTPVGDDAISGVHYYLSTGCLHGEHEYCQAKTGAAGAKVPAVCKFCAAPCRCRCHSTDRAHPDTYTTTED
jgi:hypothetical protein